MTRFKLSALATFVILIGGVHLSAGPVAAEAPFSCYEQAVQIHSEAAGHCGGEADCSFQCSPGNTEVESWECECMN